MKPADIAVRGNAGGFLLADVSPVHRMLKSESRTAFDPILASLLPGHAGSRRRIYSIAGAFLWMGASSLSADDLGLSRAFERAQEILKESRTGPAPRAAGRNWGDYVEYSNQAQDAARASATRLADVEAQLAVLDASTRAYLEQHTTPEDRSSMENLMTAVLALQRSVRTRQFQFHAEASRLRQRLGTLKERIGDLDAETFTLRFREEKLAAHLVQLQTLTRGLNERAVRLDKILVETSAIGKQLESETARSRAVYWTALDNAFTRLNLGAPRDFTPQLTPDTPVTQRRVRVTSTRPVLIPAPLVAPLAASEIVPAAAAFSLPLAASPAASAETKPLAQAIQDWATAARSLQEAQNDTESLLAGLEATEKVLTRKNAEVVRRRAENSRLDSAVNQAARAFYHSRREVEILLDRLSETLPSYLRTLGESQLWETAEDLLGKILSGSSHHGELASHFTWVMRSYVTLLRDDLPTVVELLGPNPSEKALGDFNRLVHLTENYVKEREENLRNLQIEADLEELLKPKQPAGPTAAESLAEIEIYRRDRANVAEVVRQTRLGFDPLENRFDLSQADAALRMEKHLRRRLQRSPGFSRGWHLEEDGSFIVDYLPVNNLPGHTPQEFERSLRRQISSTRQLTQLYVDLAPDLSQAQRAELRRWVESFPEAERSPIVFLERP